MRTHSVVGLAAAFVLAIATAAVAEVTWTPEAGGAVGKGDVQALFGWNNATMQANHTSITFEFEVTATYAFECEWWTGPQHNRQHHTNTKNIVVGIDALVASESRRSVHQYTGWTLSPLETSGLTGGPSDDDCGAEGNEMKSIVEGSIEMLSSGGGGLYAVYGADRRLLQSF